MVMMFLLLWLLAFDVEYVGIEPGFTKPLGLGDLLLAVFTSLPLARNTLCQPRQLSLGSLKAVLLVLQALAVPTHGEIGHGSLRCVDGYGYFVEEINRFRRVT